MENNNTNNVEQNQAIPSINPLVPTSGKFTYESIDDFVLPPDNPEFTELMSPEYKKMLDQHAKDINVYAPASIGNFNNPNPTLATDNYNPFAQQTGLDLSTPEGKLALLEKSQVRPTGEVKIADPIYEGIRSSNFDKFYNHPQFSKLGWHPYSNNDEYYNANSTWWDDYVRMGEQFRKLAGTGFLSAYRSIGDLFDSDDYLTGKDLDSAREFSDAMRIGNSTRGGFAQFSNNMLLQSGYTFGVIGSIALEELALWGAAALQGGLNPASDAAAISRTGFNIARLTKTISNTFDLSRLTNATRTMYRGLRSVDKSRDLYNSLKATGKFAGNLIAPETYQAIKTLNTAKNGAQNLSNLAKASKTFGAFYRDLRSLNLALAESKMEAGMVYDQQMANGYAYYAAKNNGDPITEDQMNDVVNSAKRASYMTTLINAPTIYLSNQLVLGNAFGSYNRSLARMVGDAPKGLAKRIIRTKGVKGKAGEIIKRPFEYARDGLKGFVKTIKAAGTRGSVKMAAGAGLRYFSANLSEGIQEIAQEAISKGTKDYYQALLEDPSSNIADLRFGSISSAIGSQFSAEGFETFMSGFLMGGIVQGPQKLFFEGVPNLYNRFADKEAFKEHQENKKKFIDSIVKSANDIWEKTATSPLESIFDTNKINLASQKQAGNDMLQAIFKSSNFDFVDAKDFSKFQSIYTVLSNNMTGDFRQQFEDYLKMSDEELIEAFPSFKKDIESGKVRERAQSMIQTIDRLEDSYNESKDKFQNPYDASIYKHGSREWNEEKIKEMSFEHARYLYMFTEDGFKRALERSQSIFDSLAAEPLFAKMAASDITVLLDNKSIEKETVMLMSELETLDQKENKDIYDAKKAKLEGLFEIQKVLNNKENQNKDGSFDRRKTKALREAFEKYAQKLANSTNGFVDKVAIDKALQKIVDYSALTARAKSYNKAIEYLNNPARFNEITERTAEYLKNAYNKRSEIFRESVKKYTGKVEINQFLNELAKLDVYPDLDQVKAFIVTGDISLLKDFYNEKGLVTESMDKELYNNIQALVSVYKRATEPEVTEQTPQEKKESKSKADRTKAVQEILSEEDLADDTPEIEIFGGVESSHPYIKEILKSQYRDYSAKLTTAGKQPSPMNTWLNSKEASDFILAYKSLKALWFNDLKQTGKDEDAILKQFNSDEGFEKWLKQQEANDLVRKVLRQTETTFTDFVQDDFSDLDVPVEPEVGDLRPRAAKVIDDTFKTVNIIEVKTTGIDETGKLKAETIYKVIDKKNKSLSEDIITQAGLNQEGSYSKIGEARNAAKAVDTLDIDTTPFTFGGVEVSYGQIVSDAEGNKYVVLGTPSQVEKGKKLFLLPADKIKQGQSKKEQYKLSKKLTEAQFKVDGYTVDDFNFTRVPKDASRILIDETVRIYPLQSGKNTDSEEDITISRARLNLILETLTPEERSNLSVVITRNENVNNTEPQKYKTRDSEGNWRESNPYINRLAEQYTIALSIRDNNLLNKINNKLEAANIPPIIDPQGRIGFIPNSSIELLNDKGQPIRNADEITAELISNTFLIYSNQQANALDTIKNNFIIQQAFMMEVANKMQDANEGIFNFNDFENFYLNESSSVDLKSNPKSLNDLKYNTVDGVRVIMINERLKDGTISTNIYTDIEDIDQEDEFIKNLMNDLKSYQPNFYETLQQSQRYVAIIKSSNGTFTGAPLKSEQLTDDRFYELSRELVERGIMTVENNLSGSGSLQQKKIKKPTFNVEFNEEFNKKLYITTNIEGYSIEVNVDSDGSFRAQVYDKQNKVVIGKAFVGGRQETLDYKGEEKPDVISLLLEKTQKAINEARKDFQNQKKKDSNINIPEWTKLKISRSNVRDSFPDIPSVDLIWDNTVTTLDENVRTNHTLRLGADSNVIEETKVLAATKNAVFTPTETFTDSLGNDIPKGKPLTTSTESLDTTEESYDSVLDMSDEVFEEFAKADFKELPFDMKKQIANKIAKGEELTEREERISKNGVAGPTIQILVSQTERSNNLVDDRKKAMQELQRVQNEIKAIEKSLYEELKQSSEKFSKEKLYKKYEENEERQKLLKTRDDLNEKLIANKIISKELDSKDIEDIEEFVEWASENLPDFITIDDINNLKDNLITNGIRVGAFALYLENIAGGMKVKGTLYTGAKNPFKYHEAFHGIFRTVLTEAEQNKLLKIASAELRKKLGSEFENELQKFRMSSDYYKRMDRQTLLNEFYEEYMADEFQKFKQNPRSTKANSAIKNFFNRLIEWIKSLFTSYNPGELQRLFNDIDSGKFKKAPAINNRFTNSLATGITINANKIIPIETILSDSGDFGYKVLSNDLQSQVVNGMTSYVLNLERENKKSTFNLKEAVNEAFIKYKILYSTDNPVYADRDLDFDQFEELDNLEKAFSDYGKFIKDAVFEQLRFYDLGKSLKEDELEELDDQVGDRLRTTDQYDKDLSSIGGFSSLSQFLRKYIGTTVIAEKDQFGNDYLIQPELDAKGNPIPGTGEKLMITVDFSTAYNGFLKAVKNLNDPIQILQRLYFFGISNPQTKAVVDRLFNDLGIVWEGQLENGLLPEIYREIKEVKDEEVVVKQLKTQGVRKPLLFQAVLKGFENARIDYIFIHRDSNGSVISYSAANRDDANTQLDRWGQAYITLYKKLVNNDSFRETAIETLKSLERRLLYTEDSDSEIGPRLKNYSDKDLIEKSKEIARVLETHLGISISPKYIEFSISKNIQNLTPYQKSLLDANANENAILIDDVQRIRIAVEAKKDLFNDNVTENANEQSFEVKNRLRRIGLGNAAFDENVGASVFKNPNGDLVYAHQLPSFHTKKIQALNDKTGNGGVLEQIKKSDEYLINNFLLNSPAFKAMSAQDRIRLLRISGSKVGDVEVDENGLLNESLGRNKTEGKTYGDSTPKEFLLNLLNSYTYGVNPKNGEVETISWQKEDGAFEFAALAPVLIRVLESSNTGDMAALPVIKAVEENSAGEVELTDETLQSFINNIEAEFKRIQKESNPETATEELHVGYNAKAIKNDDTGTEEIVRVSVQSGNADSGRAFKFNKTGVLLAPLKENKDDKKLTVDFITSDAQYERVASGEQKILLYDKKAAEEKIGFTTKGVVRQGIINDPKKKKKISKTVVSQGIVTVNDSTREGYFDMLKDLATEKKDETHKYLYKRGNAEFWFENRNFVNFLKGTESLYLYNILEATNEAEQQRELYGEGFQADGYLTILTNAARDINNQGLSLEEVLNKENISLDEFKSFLRFRLNQEFIEFKKILDSLVKTEEIGSFFKTGIQTSNGVSNTAEVIRANRYLNLKENNYDHNLKQVFFNDYVNTTAINQILLGDSAYSLKDAVDEIKRAKAQSASYYSAASSIAAPEYGINKPVQEFSAFELTEPFVPSTYNPGTTDHADAQLWMTAKAFKHFQFGFGKLTESQAELFRKIERGEAITTEDIFGTKDSSGYAKRQEMLNSQKYVYADGKTFVKMSAFALLPEFTSIKDENGNYTIPKPNMVKLHNLRVKMEAFENTNDTISVAAPRTALKMMQKNVSNIHSVTANNKPLTKEQSVTLNANFLGLQVINPSNKTVITDPTQIKSLVTSEQNDSTKVILNGKPTTVGAIRKAYHKATKDRGDLAYINKRNLIFRFDVEYAMDQLHKSIKANAITADLYSYLKYAEASLASTGSASHLMELFEERDGQPKYNLNNPLTYKKFLSLFMSYFSKSVFSEKVPGATISLVSDFGVGIYRRVLSVDENGMPDKHEVIPQALFEKTMDSSVIQFNINEGQYPGNDNNLAGLAEAVKKSKGKGVIIVDRLRHNLKEYNEKGEYTGQRYGEMLMPAHHKDVMAKLQLQDKSIPDAVAKMFAVRIPSQDNHSTYNVKQVDFMPAVYGSSGVFAREIIEISGADFDIDKVYMQFKEFYEIEGEFFEYGKPQNINDNYTDRDGYQDYIRYVNLKVEDSNSIYGEAYSKYKVLGASVKLTNKEIIDAEEYGFTEKSIDALRVLSMPVTFDQYTAYKNKFGHEPYSAAINNQILDYKFALMGNDHVTKENPLFLKEVKKDSGDNLIEKDGKSYVITTVDTGVPYINETTGEQLTAPAISYEAADMEVLKDLWDELKEELPEWAAKSEEEGIDVDNVFGKLRMFTNNKEGSRSIGAVVLPNLYLNLMQEFGVEILSEKLNDAEVKDQIEFANNNFNKFATTHEILENGGQGQRTQYIISALITAATDNAKERLLAKLGLNINALSIVANLTALGVPIKTSILLINHPTISRGYFLESLEEGSAESFIKNRIDELKKNFLDNPQERATVYDVNQNNLTESIRNPKIPSDFSFTTSEVNEAIESGAITKTDVITEISILTEFLKAANLSKTTRYIGDLLNLSSGLGQSLDDINKKNEAIKELGIGLTDREFKALGVGGPMVDVRSIFRDNTWQGGYLQRFKELTEILMPNVIVSTTPLYKAIVNSVIGQAKFMVGNELKEFKAQVEEDLLSYLTIKAYQHNNSVNDSQRIATLTNDLIYNNPDGVETISQVVERLRSIDELKSNYFLNSFIVLEDSNRKGNKTGLNLASSNTFLRYNDTQKRDIQNGFLQLYSEPLTRADARTILHYMMVKDGLQYGYKSLVQAVAPIALSGYLSHIDTIQEAIIRPKDALFKSTFGLSLEELVVEFNKGYLTSGANGYYVSQKSVKNVFNPAVKGVKTQSKIFNRADVLANPNNLYVFADNQAKQGSVTNSAVRGIDNTYGLTLKKDGNRKEESYFSDDEIGTFTDILDKEIESILSLMNAGKEVVLPKQLMSSRDMEYYKKNSPDIFEHIEVTLANNFGYKLDPKKTKVTKKKTSKKQKGKEIAITSYQALNQPVHIDQSKAVPVLTVDLYKGIVKESEVKGNSDLRTIPSNKQIESSSKLKEKFKDNLKKLEDAGFGKLGTLRMKNDVFREVEFPMVIKRNIGSFEENLYEYYLLVNVQTVNPGNTFFNVGNKIVGSKAQYIKIELQGSTAQNPIGFMFGPRPTLNIIRSFVKNINSSDYGSSNFEQQLDDFANLNFGPKKEGKVVSANDPLTGTNKGIDVNNKNIADYEQSDSNFENDVNAGTTPQDDSTFSNVDFTDDASFSFNPNQFLNQFMDTNESEFSELTSWWDENIDDVYSDQAKANRDKLKAIKADPNTKFNITSLEDFIKEFEKSEYTTEEDFIEHFKDCYLK